MTARTGATGDLAGTTSASAVAEYYDRWTPRYLDAFGDTIQAHRPADESDLHAYLLRRSGLRKGKTALDAGCGVCGPARYFARESGARIDALTVSPVQARLARERIAGDGLSGSIRVFLGDFHRLDRLFPPESYDLVYFLESLSHSPDPAAVLRGVHRVLKPGGVVYIKDYFIRVCDSAEEQERVLGVVETVDRLFETHTAWADDAVDALRRAGFLPLFVEAPDFSVDNRPWQTFERDNRLDLFDGGESFDWSHWLELKFQKP